MPSLILSSESSGNSSYHFWIASWHNFNSELISKLLLAYFKRYFKIVAFSSLVYVYVLYKCKLRWGPDKVVIKLFNKVFISSFYFTLIIFNKIL